MVISAMPMPPLMMASAARNASSGEGARTIGTSPTSRMSARDLSLVQGIAVSPTIAGRRPIRAELGSATSAFEVAALRPFRVEKPTRLARHPQARTFQQTLDLGQRRPVEITGIRVLQGAEGVAVAD